MIEVGGLPCNWRLGYEVEPTTYLVYPEKPYFIRSDGAVRTPKEVARYPEGRAVFVAVKRWLDHADMRFGNGANSRPDWRAVDKAKMAMHVELVRTREWDDALLDTGVEAA